MVRRIFLIILKLDTPGVCLYNAVYDKVNLNQEISIILDYKQLV